jgi:hypothetical protein
MKREVIPTVMLLFAGLAAPSSSGIYITEINHENGTFHLSNRTYWRTLFPRTVQHWRTGDDVTGARNASCGNDPNVYLLTDTSESESACAQQVGR